MMSAVHSILLVRVRVRVCHCTQPLAPPAAPGWGWGAWNVVQRLHHGRGGMAWGWRGIIGKPDEVVHRAAQHARELLQRLCRAVGQTPALDLRHVVSVLRD